MKKYLLICFLFASTFGNGLLLNTNFGEYEITEPVLIELIESPQVQRLKHIHQYGTLKYVMPLEDYTRYEHSVGVFILLRNFGASLEEQIAGLLHDVSHTVFSHVGDHVFYSHGDNAYQDDIHSWYINKSNLIQILQKYNYSAYDINPKNGRHQMLDQKLPDLCADRIEYNIIGGIKRNLITQQEGDAILADLHYEDGHWYLQDPLLARLLANMSLNMTINLWGSKENGVIYLWTADALRKSFELGILTLDDFHFSTDDVVWETLLNSDDSVLQELMYKMLHYPEFFELVDVEEADFIIKAKFRGVNPLVKIGSTYFHLTELDVEFAKDYEKIRDIANHGWGIRWLVPEKI